MFGDGRDRRIDFIEADAIAGLAISGDGAHAQADDADVPRAVCAAQPQRKADARILSVVSGGRFA